MNKNIVVGIIGLLILSSVVSYKIYSNKKSQLLEKNQRLFILKNKLDKIVALQNKYKNINLNRLTMCRVENLAEKDILECKNLDKNSFRRVENYVFKANVKLNKFSIEKNRDKVNLSVELMKWKKF